MDDEEALMENDPLAIYLKDVNISDFEIINKCKKETVSSVHAKKNKTIVDNKDFQMYIEIILKSELLFEEDHNILEIFYQKNAVCYSKLKPILSVGGVFTLAYVVKQIMLKLDILYLFVPLCVAPITWTVFQYIRTTCRKKIMSSLLQNLNNLTELFKKSLRVIKEASTNFSYYSSTTLVNSTLHKLHVRFAKELYSVLLMTIKLLALKSSEIIKCVPLSLENVLYHNINDDYLMKTDVKISDLKLLYELYLLVQSDFVKTVGLSFCTQLWTNPNCDILQITSTIVPSLSLFIQDQTKYLNNEYMYVKNFGIRSEMKYVKKNIRKLEYAPIDCLMFCLNNNTSHFQQLLNKSLDLEKYLSTIYPDKLKENENFILSMLKEMDHELTASKNMLDTMTKYFVKIKSNSDEPIAIENKVPKAEVDKEVKPDDVKLESEIYELYIPKEGLDFSDTEPEEQPVFSLKDVDYSCVLLEELRCVLKARNPDTYQDDIKSQSSEDSEPPRKPQIFRPMQQPVGLSENLLSFGALLQQRTAQRQEEQFGDDSSHSSFDENMQ